MPRRARPGGGDAEEPRPAALADREPDAEVVGRARIGGRRLDAREHHAGVLVGVGALLARRPSRHPARVRALEEGDRAWLCMREDGVDVGDEHIGRPVARPPASGRARRRGPARSSAGETCTRGRAPRPA